MSNPSKNRQELFNRRKRSKKERIPKEEMTFVERRSTATRRVWRRVRVFIPIGLFLFWIYSMWTNPVVANISFTVLGYVFRIMFAITFIVVQFVALFWFLSRSRTYDIYPDRSKRDIGYEDYRGQPELLERAKQIVSLLRGVRKFEVMGGQPLTGLLLEGPPGTGKTWLARVIATEAGVPFFYTDASSLQAMFIGIGPLKVMRMYAKARKAAREYGASIVFMDEIDSIGASRGGVSGGGGQGQIAGGAAGLFGGGSFGLLSTLLVEMDGFGYEHGAKAKRREFFWNMRLRHIFLRLVGRPIPPLPATHKRVLTIGATNRVAVLDPALMRPGRFDKVITVDLPNMEGRKDIIQYYLDKMVHDDTIRLDRLAQDMVRFSPADIKHILNDALRVALFDGRDKMSYKDILQAMPEFTMGLRQPIPNQLESDRVAVAYHEAGHAVVEYALRRNKNRISRLTIVRYGGALGHMAPKEIRESTHTSRTDLENGICVSFGGRAAEHVFLGDISTGASADLQNIQARLLAMANSAMLDDYYIGFLNNNEYKEAPDVVKKKFEELYQRTLDIIEGQRDAVEELVGALLEKEELSSDGVEEILTRYEWDPVPEAPGMRNGSKLGKHYIERVIDVSENGQDGHENGSQPEDAQEDESLGEPAGD